MKISLKISLTGLSSWTIHASTNYSTSKAITNKIGTFQWLVPLTNQNIFATFAQANLTRFQNYKHTNAELTKSSILSEKPSQLTNAFSVTTFSKVSSILKKTHAQNCSKKLPTTEVEHILSQVPPAQSSSFSAPAQAIPAKSHFFSFISPAKVTTHTEPMYIETSQSQLSTEPTAVTTETKVQTNLLQLSLIHI